MIYKKIEDLVGETPLLEISEEIHGIPRLRLYAKLEMMNPFGSIKDRVAKNMLMNNITKIKKENRTVIESSSGNTAKALAALCSKNGISFKTISNRIKVEEIRDILKFLDVDVTELPGSSECPDPTSPEEPVDMIERSCSENPEKYHHTDQYFNKRNIEAHKETGKEIHDDLGDIDYLFADLGTCGSSRGIGEKLREVQKKEPKIIGVITAEGGFVPGGRNENELYETGFFDKNFYNNITKDSTKSAVKGMRELNLKSGLLCGPTTGLVYSALKEYFKKNLPKTKTKAVFIACDRLESYLSYVKKYMPEVFSSRQEERKSVTIDMARSVKQITSDELEKMNEKDALLIDMRTSYAFSMGHIKGSMNIPEHMLEELISQGKSFPKKNIVLICPIGNKSVKYAAMLENQGYKTMNLKGGLKAWIDSGKTLEQENFC